MEGKQRRKWLLFLKIKNKKSENTKLVRAVSYLDFTSFHQCTMKFLFGPLCICTCLKCYKTKTLQGKEKGNRDGGKRMTGHYDLNYFY